MKVIFVGGECAFCQGFAEHYPESSASNVNDRLVTGRAYHVVEILEARCWWPPFLSGRGYRLAEITLPPNWGHCSCAFREVEGDADAWHRLLEENRPKTKELEPA